MRQSAIPTLQKQSKRLLCQTLDVYGPRARASCHLHELACFVSSYAHAVAQAYAGYGQGVPPRWNRDHSRCGLQSYRGRRRGRADPLFQGLRQRGLLRPIVRRLIRDSLHHWVDVIHVDGFRFDLASILSRDESGRPLANPPILWDIDSAPGLADTKLIAEAWDAGRTLPTRLIRRRFLERESALGLASVYPLSRQNTPRSRAKSISPRKGEPT